MRSYFIFILVFLFCHFLAEYTRKKGFENLNIKRVCEKNVIFPGEEFKIVTQIENKKWFPISFLNVEEEYPQGMERVNSKSVLRNSSIIYYVSSYTILWYERIKRYHSVVINKRGVYYLRNIKLHIGDAFGFSSNEEIREDLIEIVVYPRLSSAKNLKFENNSIQGDIVVKRWIFSDPLYIRGVREYTKEDRMKDIHWNSSLRMNKLMVKEYDYTSEREVVFIINVQSAKPYWSFIDGDAIERSIKVTVALSNSIINQGIPTGVTTNAQMVNYRGDFLGEVLPGINNFKEILELCARMDKAPKLDFDQFLKERAKYFNRNSIYVIVTSYLDEEIIEEIAKLRKYGFMIKIIDTSKNSSLPLIDHVEKISYKGEGRS